jgi:hypothetical protein
MFQAAFTKQKGTGICHGLQGVVPKTPIQTMLLGLDESLSGKKKTDSEKNCVTIIHHHLTICQENHKYKRLSAQLWVFGPAAPPLVLPS